MKNHENSENAFAQMVLGTTIDGQTIHRRLRTLTQNAAILLNQISSIVDDNYNLRSDVAILKKQVNLLFAKTKGQNHTRV